MDKLFITKDNLKALIENLKHSCDEFIAPKKEHSDDIIFGDTKADGRELLDYEGNSVISPRSFLLPQTEVLFEIKSARRNELKSIEDKKRRIFYGIRPCDMKALVLMRSFFLDEFVDMPYKQKLERSTFIVLACNKFCSDKAFCCEMDAGPVAKEGFDLQLTAIGKGYLVDVGSKEGSQIAGKNKKLFQDSKPKDIDSAVEMLKALAKGCERIDSKKLAKIMKDDKVNPSIWDDIGLRCVVCSGCITLCPTCTCFSIADRLEDDAGVRLRYCDGCPYAGFTKMAGGTMPFVLHKDHIRRFFEHKLNHDVDRYGTPGCVGCARCIQTCPGNISIRRFIEEAVK